MFEDITDEFENPKEKHRIIICDVCGEEVSQNQVWVVKRPGQRDTAASCKTMCDGCRGELFG